VSLRTICSGLCRFLVAMILLSLPAHSVGCKTLISHGPTDRGQATGGTGGLLLGQNGVGGST
ncbi:hypothetical protein PJN94_18990, partial [Mycobacterium kansasii]